MIRVCYVIPSLDIGGTERQLVRLIGGLGPGYEVTVYCTRREGDLAPEARHHGAFVECLDLGSGWDLRLRARLRNEFRRHRPDILHTFLSGFDLQANLAAKQTGVPVVISSRREIADWMRPRHVRAQRKANRYVDAIVCNAYAVKEAAVNREKGDPNRYHVVPNGILAEAFMSMADPEQVRSHHRIPMDRKIICTVANFSAVKDYPLFVDIAQKLMAERDDLHFLTVGRGPLFNDIARRIKRYNLQDHFSHSATIPGVSDLLKISSVFVLTSRMEGFPNAVMEAMAASKPVVAANTGGIPELVEHGKTGRLVNERSAEAFAGEIRWCLENSDESAFLGQEASRTVREQFSLDRMVQTYKQVYAALIASRARRAV